MRTPRLKQPLFGEDYPPLASAQRMVMRSYNAIYNLLYAPSDVRPADIRINAEAVLLSYAFLLEEQHGAHLFENND